MDEELCRAIEAVPRSGLIVVLTGAGISAESGIPTFRGKDGYWTVGSQEYHPQEMATSAMFESKPKDVWRWYLYRRAACHDAQPNPAHLALVPLERALGDRFLLVTQNVDGLHLRAGNSADRFYEIHGNIDQMRCSRPCSDWIVPIDKALDNRDRHSRLTDEECWILRCPHCGDWARPHVLWFDESYNETLYHFDSSLKAASQSALFLVIGTSGNTNLPLQMGYHAARRNSVMIEVNTEPTPFTQLAGTTTHGLLATGMAGELVPAIVDRLIALQSTN